MTRASGASAWAASSYRLTGLGQDRRRRLAASGIGTSAGMVGGIARSLEAAGLLNDERPQPITRKHERHLDELHDAR